MRHDRRAAGRGVTIMVERPVNRRRPSFRPKAERGLDQFDTPPIALPPLFVHEPLLANVTSICDSRSAVSAIS
jgi:hypothetical protein